MLLKNKWGIVTGCNRGIGYNILETFSKNGSNLYACIRKIDDKFLDKKKKLKSKIKTK